MSSYAALSEEPRSSVAYINGTVLRVHSKTTPITGVRSFVRFSGPPATECDLPTSGSSTVHSARAQYIRRARAPAV